MVKRVINETSLETTVAAGSKVIRNMIFLATITVSIYFSELPPVLLGTVKTKLKLTKTRLKPTECVCPVPIT